MKLLSVILLVSVLSLTACTIEAPLSSVPVNGSIPYNITLTSGNTPYMHFQSDTNSFIYPLLKNEDIISNWYYKENRVISIYDDGTITATIKNIVYEGNYQWLHTNIIVAEFASNTGSFIQVFLFKPIDDCLYEVSTIIAKQEYSIELTRCQGNLI